MPGERAALTAQGGYYVVTGAKTEWWLVQTVGAIVTVVGCALVSGPGSGRVTRELRGLAAGCAAGLAGIDVYYAMRRRIAPTYLLDAAAQVVFLAWLARGAAER